MTLRINDREVSIVGGNFVSPPSLIEELTDTFEFRAAPDVDVELLLDGSPMPAHRDYHDPQIVRWEWEKGRFGRVGFVEAVLQVQGLPFATGLLRVEPRKLSLEQYAALLDEIAQLAYNIIYDLRETTFEHLDLIEPDRMPKSGVEWLETIRGFLPRLEDALERINKQPHRRLRLQETERFVWQVRRPGPSLLDRVHRGASREWIPDAYGRVPALSIPLGGRLPLRLPEAHHDIDTDTYENQLIAQFLEGVGQRLRLVGSQAAQVGLRETAIQLLRRLEALRALPFLEGVSRLRHPPRPTLVLLRNNQYRRFYEVFRRFHYGLRIRYGSDLSADLFHLTTQYVHKTYQAWVFFKVVEAVKLVTGAQAVLADRIIEIVRFDELLVDLREGSRVVLAGLDGPGVTVRYQPTFGSPTPDGPFSVSLPKRPDVVVESEDGSMAIIFDAKYRLDSEDRERPSRGWSEPKPEDIDKMHTYRDAIRVGAERQPYISAAYVCYPGTATELYDNELIGAIPLRPDKRSETLIALLKRAFTS